MKRNTYRLTSLLLLTVLLAGCTIEVSDEIGDNGGLVPIYLTAEVADAGNGGSATRAGTDIQSTQLASGETFTVEFSSNTTVASTTYRANGSGGTTCTGTQPYFTLDGSSTTAYGYYPSKPGSTFSVQADQSGDANYKKSDLMYASVEINKSAGSGSGKLTFAHKMAKIIVNITRGDGISSISAVKIVGGYRTINVTNTTNCTLGTTLTNANSSTNITVYSGNSTAATLNCAALIPPQTVSGNFLVVTTDQGDVTYSLDSKVFASGQSYTFNITVNAAAIGSTVAITNWTNNGNATVNPTKESPNPTISEHVPSGASAVDLGLSVKWANMNVGATTATDYGTYFAWGETIGYTVTGHSSTAATPAPTKTTYSKDTYWWGSPAVKYNSTDGKTTLDASDDAAYVNWGGKWRMPTQANWEELGNTNNCTWAWQSNYNSSGVAGYLVTSKKSGYTSKSIFLPCAGMRSSSFSGQGTYGYYSSSSRVSDSQMKKYYLQSSGYWASDHDRYAGLTVRPVQSK